MPSIIINRKKQWLNLFRRYKVYINDEFVGTLPNGGSIRREVEPGKNELHLWIEWCGSPPVEFRIESGEIKTFKATAQETAHILNAVMVLLISVFLLFPPRFLHVPWFISMGLVVLTLLMIVYHVTLGRDKFISVEETEFDPVVRYRESG